MFRHLALSNVRNLVRNATLVTKTQQKGKAKSVEHSLGKVFTVHAVHVTSLAIDEIYGKMRWSEEWGKRQS